MICVSCSEDKPPRMFGSNPRRIGGLDPRCKLCIAEQVKASIRRKTLAKFELDITAWPVVMLDSEIEYLQAKLRVLRLERKGRL